MNKKHGGVVVPMITPVTQSGQFDPGGARRVIDFLLEAGVEGIFVLGTTGEAASVPRAHRFELVQLTINHVNGRARVYAGLNDNSFADSIEAGNQYLAAGVDAVVSLLPSYFSIQPQEILAYYRRLLDALNGPTILYNIPATTHLSVPIEVLEQLVGHPHLAGLKDSENNRQRFKELLMKFGSRSDFSLLVGVGEFMGEMVLLGADGIVPSIGNLAPGLCCELCRSAILGDRTKTEAAQRQMWELSALCRNGRNLGQSLAALKLAMSFYGLCEPAVLPPLLPLDPEAGENLRMELLRFAVLKEA